jgi:hypothetical protein
MLAPAHISMVRQAHHRLTQCDFARGQSEPVEDCAFAITEFFNKT